MAGRRISMADCVASGRPQSSGAGVDIEDT